MPHLSARLLVDVGHLKGILGRLDEIGVSDVLVIGGDVDEQVGRFAGAFELLEAMAQLGHCFDAIGIAGYLESHPFISDEQTIETMFAKARSRRTGRLVVLALLDIDARLAVMAERLELASGRETHLAATAAVPGVLRDPVHSETPSSSTCSPTPGGSLAAALTCAVKASTACRTSGASSTA